MIAVKRYADPIAFRDAVYPFLLANEAANCFGIGLVDTLITKPDRYPDFYLAVIESKTSGRVAGACWITPPFPLGITEIPAGSIPAVIRFVRQAVPQLSGIVGPCRSARRCRDAWMRETDATLASEMRQGIYELRTLNELTLARGTMRLASGEDRDLLIRWSRCFSIDCGLPDDGEAAKVQADFAIEHQIRHFWEVDGSPVSMAGVSGNTPSGIRVNFVYTPPELRGNGYATALVTRLSQLQFDAGKKCCFLFTDLANPTSNAIYQRIGYRMVAEAVHYEFGYVVES